MGDGRGCRRRRRERDRLRPPSVAMRRIELRSHPTPRPGLCAAQPEVWITLWPVRPRKQQPIWRTNRALVQRGLCTERLTCWMRRIWLERHQTTVPHHASSAAGHAERAEGMRRVSSGMEPTPSVRRYAVASRSPVRLPRCRFPAYGTISWTSSTPGRRVP